MTRAVSRLAGAGSGYDAAVTPAWDQLLAVVRDGEAPDFSVHPDDLDVDEPVRRHLGAAIAPGTPAAAAVRLRMHGRLRLGRWLPFRAHQLLAPHHGTVWEARVAGLISGADHFVAGAGGMDWRLPGRFPVMHQDGPDVSRSAAERAAAESVWAPTAVLPGPGVHWSAVDDEHLQLDLTVDRHPVTVHLRIDGQGRLRAAHLDRWGDPDGDGTWAARPFGVEVTAHRTFAGVTIPSAGRVGWYPGTERWAAGEFFRFTIDDLDLVLPR